MSNVQCLLVLAYLIVVSVSYDPKQVIVKDLDIKAKIKVNNRIFYPPFEKRDKVSMRKLYQGPLATIEQFPYMVRLIIVYADSTGICGGTLIHKKYVLTAYHCLKWFDVVRVNVCLGADELPEAVCPTTLLVARKIFALNSGADLLIMRLSEAVEETEKIKAKAVKEFNVEGLQEMTCYGPGWGLHQKGVLTSHLRYTEFKLVSSFSIGENIAVYSQEHNACRGDSGSPLVCDDIIVGLASSSSTASCGSGAGETYYLNLNPHYKFITDVCAGKYDGGPGLWSLPCGHAVMLSSLVVFNGLVGAFYC